MVNDNEINQILKEFSFGDKNKAYNNLKKIFDKNRSNYKLQFNLAVIQHSLGKYEEAKENYKILIGKKKDRKVIINLFAIYLLQENYNEALDLINILYVENIESVAVAKEKAFVLYKLKKYDESTSICFSILKKNKSNVDIINIIGFNYFEKQNFKESEKFFKKTLRIEPNNIVALNAIGRLYHEQRDTVNAEKYLLKAYKLKRDSYEIINNLANHYKEILKYKKAIVLYTKALKYDKKNPTILNNLAKTYFDISDLDKAEYYCKKALMLSNDDNIKMILSLIYLKKQKYSKAWKYFDGRISSENFAKKNILIGKIREKANDKKNLNQDSKILILREQGIGDELLYGTMYKDIFRLWKNVTIECDKRLINLFKNSFKENKEQFVKLGSISENSSALSKYDFVFYSGSLGQYVRNNINNFKSGIYLKADEYLVTKSIDLLKKSKKKYNIGISWKSFNNRYTKEKSLSLNEVINLLKNKDYNFINLQYGDVSKEIYNINKKLNNKISLVKDLDIFNDFDYLSGVLKSIDLFISVSNSTAHLAGALGVKTLLIKPESNAIFHYWNQKNERTPWYSSVKLVTKNTFLKNKNLVEDFLNF